MTRRDRPDQLTLAVGLRDSAGFDNFYAPASAHVLAAVKGLAHARKSASVFVFGDSGCGKTHLGWAACRAAREAGDPALYVPMREPELARSMLSSVPEDALICLDDLDAVANDPEFNEPLFHFVEQLSHLPRLRILFTASAAPRHLGFQLPDLVSRLNAAPAYQLASLSDPEKAEAFRLRGEGRGLVLGSDVIDYILRHHARDTHTLFELLSRIDDTALASQRRVTLPLVREILQSHSAAR